MLPSRFSLDAHYADRTLHLRVRGDLDLATAGRVAHAAADLRGVERVVVDLRDLGFADVSAVHALIDLDARCAGAGAQLEVVVAQDAAPPVFAVLRLDERLRVRRVRQRA